MRFVLYTLLLLGVLLAIGCGSPASSTAATMSPTGTQTMVFYYNLKQAEGAISSQDLGNGFVLNSYYFVLYSDKQLTQPLGNLVASITNFQHGSLTYQTGPLTFFFPQGNVTIDTSTVRTEADKTPGLDPNSKLTFSIVDGTGIYTGASGSVLYETTDYLRTVTMTITTASATK